MAASPPRILLANADVSVGLIPGLGAKLDSLRHRASGREWLLAAPRPLPSRHTYASTFTEAPLCGWDEILPTVEECRYPCDPHAGVALPDHGEVWALPWQVTRVSGHSAACTVAGRALPYRLSREVVLDGPAIEMRYELAAVGDHELVLLWCPHPQFAVRPGTVLRLPSTADQLITVTPDGTRRTLVVDPRSLDWTRMVPAGQDLMLYLPPQIRVGWAELRDPDGCWLRMSWTTRHVPYLAVWMDHGRYSPGVICPEPMTGWYDELDGAHREGRILTVAPGRPVHWSIRVTVGRN